MARSTPSFKELRSSSGVASRVHRASSRKSDTKCEVTLRSRLFRLGLRFRKNVRNLPGKPDIVFPGARVVVFCDGDFWHGNNWSERKRKLADGSNPEYWIAKISSNMRRDATRTAELEADGWTVLRLWESRIIADVDSVAAEVEALVRSQLAGRAR